MKYYHNTYSNAEGFIVNDDGSYVEWVYPVDYVRKQYNWAVLSKKAWWQKYVVEVSKEEFYAIVDKSIKDYYLLI